MLGRPSRAGAVGDRLAEVGHRARVRDEAPAVVSKQPGLERVEAHRAPPRRPRALVQDHHPGQALAILVGGEHLEPGVRLLAPRVGAYRAEGGHAGAAEIAKGARVGAVLVAECTVVARVARRVPGGPAVPPALDAVALVYPVGAERRAVRGRRLRAVDRVGGRGRLGGGSRQPQHEEKQEHRHRAKGGRTMPPGRTTLGIGARVRFRLRAC